MVSKSFHSLANLSGRNCNNLIFLEYLGTWKLPIKKTLNQPYQSHGMSNMVLTTLGNSIDGFQQVSEFLFFIGPALIGL